MEEWVEVRAKTVDEAIEEGLRALGLTSREEADIEVLQEAQKGFLGFGGEPALIRLKTRPKSRKRRRGKGGSGNGRERGAGDSRRERVGAEGGRERGRSPERSTERRPGAESERGRGDGRSGDRQRGPRQERPQPGRGEPRRATEAPAAAASDADLSAQAEIVRGFLVGLLDAFGLEGEVTTRTEGDIIYADVSGDQTEALVGTKGAILEAVMELCRTMVHRHSGMGARLRLDIAGYAERRRAALRIYAGRLAEKVLDEGGEIMLESMNPADRKVVHDAIAEIDGVRSFSEGEDPERSVVIAPDDEEAEG
jgi:spoIIIJ-associated protein